MTATTAGVAPLALPSAGGERPQRITSLTTILAGASLLMLFGSLCGAFLLARHLSHGSFRPKGVRVDRYIANMVTITMVMGAFTVEWAANAVRRVQKRQAAVALLMTTLFGLSTILLISYACGHLHITPTGSPYGAIMAAMVLLLGLSVGLATGFVTLSLFRLAGDQVSAAEPDMLRAAAWFWHFVVVATIVVRLTVLTLLK